MYAPSMLAAAGPTPRVVGQHERVPPGSGLSRFKVTDFGVLHRYTEYILAENAESARACFLARARRDADATVDVTRLPD